MLIDHFYILGIVRRQAEAVGTQKESLLWSLVLEGRMNVDTEVGVHTKKGWRGGNRTLRQFKTMVLTSLTNREGMFIMENTGNNKRK